MSDQHRQPNISGMNSSEPSPSTPVHVGQSRERVLILSLAILAGLFVVTAFLARQYHRSIHHLGDDWYAKGESSLKSRDAAAAIQDYRNALVYKPGDPTFEFHLAQALARSGRDELARSYFLTLLSASPGSGKLNLALARIAAQENSPASAVRYYHNAIYGVWEENPLSMRWQVRRELCQYLLDLGAVQEAQPDVIALAQEVSRSDYARQKITADLLLRAALWNRALDMYRSVLLADSRDHDALAGAGQAAFHLGRYGPARNYFDRLPRERREAPEIAGMAGLSSLIEEMNPLLPGLPASEQRKRADAILGVATARLENCAQQRGITLPGKPPLDPFQQIYSTGREMSRSWRRAADHASERAANAVSLAARMEEAASERCGAPQNRADQAVLLISQGSEGTSR